MSGSYGPGWGCNPLYIVILGTIGFMYGFRVRSRARLPRVTAWTFFILLPLIIYAITSNLNHSFDIYTLADLSTALAPVLIAFVGAACGTAAGGLA